MPIRVSWISTFSKNLTESGLIWFSEVLQVQWHHFFQELTYPTPCALASKFWNFYGGQKVKFSIPFILWSKRFALMRRFQLWSQKSNWVTFYLLLAGKRLKTSKHPILPVFDPLLAKRGQMLSDFNFERPYLESSHEGESFRPQIKSGLKTLLFAPHKDIKTWVLMRTV